MSKQIANVLIMGILAGLVTLIVNPVRGVIILLCIICLLSVFVLIGSFEYPHFVKEFDLTGKHRQNMQDCIRKFCNEEYTAITQHELSIIAWEIERRGKIQKSRFKKLRELRKHAFERVKAKGEKCAYEFRFVRYYTVRRQKNGVGYVDEEKHITERFFCDYEYLRGLSDKIGVLDIGINEANEVVSIEASK